MSWHGVKSERVKWTCTLVHMVRNNKVTKNQNVLHLVFKIHLLDITSLFWRKDKALEKVIHQVEQSLAELKDEGFVMLQIHQHLQKKGNKLNKNVNIKHHDPVTSLSFSQRRYYKLFN